MQRNVVKALLAALLMTAASVTAYVVTPRTYMADLHPREKLSAIVPQQFGDWRVDTSIVPVPPSPDLQEVIDRTYDETVSLTYRNAAGQRVMLSLAYGRNQHKGMNTHKPEVCYPAQGFKVVQSPQRSQLEAAGRSLQVTRLAAELGSRHEPITYWLLVGDKITTFGYPQRASAIRYGLTGVIPDGVLVRVSSIDADNAAAFALQAQFIRDMLGAIAPQQLPRLLGSA